MSDKPKKINLAGFFHTECSAPGWDGASTLTLHGRSPGGQMLVVAITIAPSGLGYLGRTVHAALDKHAANIDDAKQRAKGEIQ
jgi:hypothetical protein